MLEEIEKQIVRRKYYRGEYYEITPFSYHRIRLKQGNLVRNLNGIKCWDNVIYYGFKAKEETIEVKEGCEIPDAFDYEFIFRGEIQWKTMSFNNSKQLLNVSFHTLDDKKRIVKTESQDRFGLV